MGEEKPLVILAGPHHCPTVAGGRRAVFQAGLQTIAYKHKLPNGQRGLARQSIAEAERVGQRGSSLQGQGSVRRRGKHACMHHAREGRRRRGLWSGRRGHPGAPPPAPAPAGRACPSPASPAPAIPPCMHVRLHATS
jgi:hypothetical protein